MTKKNLFHTLIKLKFLIISSIIYINCTSSIRNMNKSQTKKFIKSKLDEVQIENEEFKKDLLSFLEKRIDDSPLADDQFFGKEQMKKIHIMEFGRSVDKNKVPQYLKEFKKPAIKKFINSLPKICLDKYHELLKTKIQKNKFQTFNINELHEKHTMLIKGYYRNLKLYIPDVIEEIISNYNYVCTCPKCTIKQINYYQNNFLKLNNNEKDNCLILLKKQLTMKEIYEVSFWNTVDGKKNKDCFAKQPEQLYYNAENLNVAKIDSFKIDYKHKMLCYAYLLNLLKMNKTFEFNTFEKYAKNKKIIDMIRYYILQGLIKDVNIKINFQKPSFYEKINRFGDTDSFELKEFSSMIATKINFKPKPNVYDPDAIYIEEGIYIDLQYIDNITDIKIL